MATSKALDKFKTNKSNASLDVNDNETSQNAVTSMNKSKDGIFGKGKAISDVIIVTN